MTVILSRALCKHEHLSPGPESYLSDQVWRPSKLARAVDHKSQLCNKSREKFARLKRKEKFRDKSPWLISDLFIPAQRRPLQRPHLACIAWQIHARAGFIANLMTSANCFIRNFWKQQLKYYWEMLFYAFSARRLQIILIFYDQP